MYKNFYLNREAPSVPPLHCSLKVPYTQYMTLHNTAELMKKGGIASSIGIGVILLIFIFFKVGVFVNSVLNPPRIDPANQEYGKIPRLAFPQSTVKGDYTYALDTLTGELPTDFPDRLIIYPMNIKQASLMDLQNTKTKIAALGFVDMTGNPLPEIPHPNNVYEWREPRGIQKKILVDVVSQNFTLTSNYMYSNTVLRAASNLTEVSAFGKAQEMLTDLAILPTDVDFEKTRNPDPEIKYITKPQLLRINGNELLPATSLSKAQIVRVDLYQKNIQYKFTAGKGENLTSFQEFEMDIPVIYPHPPLSTMNFLVASGENENEVVSAIYNHQSINTTPEKEATYPIKSPEEAFEELKSGNAYLASYNGTDEQVMIENVFLAYYLGEIQQEYLMPVIVFQGKNGFFAYISAVKEEALQD